MVTIRAKVFLHKNRRKTPFVSGYRPLFDFFRGSLVTGQIDLVKASSLAPGEEDVAIVKFVNEELVGDLKVGQIFAYSEGESKLGTITVLELIQCK